MNLKFILPLIFNEEFKKREFNTIKSAKALYSNLKNKKIVEDYWNKFFMITNGAIYKIKKISLDEVDYYDNNDIINGNFTLFSMNDSCIVDSENNDYLEFTLRIQVKNWNIYDMTLSDHFNDIEIMVVYNGKLVRNIDIKSKNGSTTYQFSYYGSAL